MQTGTTKPKARLATRGFAEYNKQEVQKKLTNKQEIYVQSQSNSNQLTNGNLDQLIIKLHSFMVMVIYGYVKLA